MANSSRLYKDKSGNMFIPMNVQGGGGGNEQFITLPKLLTIMGLILGLVLMIVYMVEIGATVLGYVIMLSIWAIASVYIVRFYVFEEKFYYRMYKQMKVSEITTPSIFWDIASIKDTHEGALITYADAKIGVMVRIERGTITGKPSGFHETHYDAISEFYKGVVGSRYSFVQMNIMEPAGNDPRLEELDKLLFTSDNENIRLLMEKQIGFIKNITHKTLYESDYFLIYTNDLSKIDSIMTDVGELLYEIMSGAYVGYTILNSQDIVEFIKEEYGVKYFNYTSATLEMFNNHGVGTKSPFLITRLGFTDGDEQTLKPEDVNKLNAITLKVMEGSSHINDVSLKDTFYIKRSKRKKGVEFRSLSDGFVERHGVKPSINGVKAVTVDKVQVRKEDIRVGSSKEVDRHEFDILGSDIDDGFDLNFSDMGE